MKAWNSAYDIEEHQRGQIQIDEPKFIIDQNVGKLTKLLRLLGFDTTFFMGENDSQLIDIALDEKRIILTRDTHFLERRAVTSGQVKVILFRDDNIENQIKKVVDTLDLRSQSKPFSLCLECNQPLERKIRDAVKNRVPPYVWNTQREYMECQNCHRLYWKGTHWTAMTRRIAKIFGSDSNYLSGGCDAEEIG